MCEENTTRVIALAHHASGARGLATLLARILTENPPTETEIMSNKPATLPAHVREKKAWDTRKKRQQALVQRYGSYATNKRLRGYIGAANGPAADPVPLTRQVARQNQRRALKAMLSDQKAHAMKEGRKGGAAAVLSVEVS